MYDVLLLEDERTVRQLLHCVLTDAGWRVQQAAAVDEAFAVLNDAGAKVLVADKRLLRGEDGHDFAKTARRLWPDLSVIFISSDEAALSALDLQDGEWSLSKSLLTHMLVELVATAMPADKAGPMEDLPFARGVIPAQPDPIDYHA